MTRGLENLEAASTGPDPGAAAAMQVQEDGGTGLGHGEPSAAVGVVAEAGGCPGFRTVFAGVQSLGPPLSVAVCVPSLLGFVAFLHLRGTAVSFVLPVPLPVSA